MGGASGHIQHLHENRDLKFGELKSILRLAATGRLERASEKLDGQALTFTWRDGLLAARSTGDIIRGGMTATELGSRFGDKLWVAMTFVSAFRVLERALGALPTHVRQQVFGHGQRWYGVEIIHDQNPNVIHYDNSALVLHEGPVFSVVNGRTATIDGSGGVATLGRYVDRMQEIVAPCGWRFRASSAIELPRLKNKRALADAIHRLEMVQRLTDVRDRSTLDDHLERLFADKVIDLCLDRDVSRMIVERCLERPGCPTLTQVKKAVPSSRVEDVSRLINSAEAMTRTFLRPIELLVHDFAVALLQNVQSSLVDDVPAAILGLRARVQRAITDIKGRGDERSIALLQQNLAKLGDIDRVNSSVEGIVFSFKGQTMKFTGSFAPVNQILGMYRYDRSGVGPKKTAERS